MTKLQKWGLGLGLLLIILLAIRLALPYAMKAYINHQLAHHPEYTGEVRDVSLQVLAGGVSVAGIHIASKSDEDPKPVLDIGAVYTHIEWTALLKGHLYITVLFTKPELYLIVKHPEQPSKSAPQPTESWQMMRSILLPIKINKVEVHEGILHYLDLTTPSPFDMKIMHINANLTGLQDKADVNYPLPALLNLTAQTVGEGEAQFHLAFDPHAALPAFKIDGQIEHLQLNQLNGFLKNYTSLRIKQGEFNFYMEAAAKGGYVKGYAKPMFKNLKVTLAPEAQGNVFKRMYRTVVQSLANLLKNNDTGHIATQVNLSGKINDPNQSGLWSVIGTLLRNAFLEALLPGIDSSIQYK